MYACEDNFTGKILYFGLDKAWLHPEAARAVDMAQRELSAMMPGLSLLIKDAARLMGVQRDMYEAVKGTPEARYVANPSNGGGLHNYGLAVDVTIVDANGNELDMGTAVDHMRPETNVCNIIC